MDNSTVKSTTESASEVTDDTFLAEAQKQMYDGDFASAETTVKKFLKEMPDHVDGIYMLAVSQRHQKKYLKAQKNLNQLRTLAPEFGRAFQEQGHLFRDQGQTTHALNAYQMATQFNPALDASWREQVKILKSQNRVGEAGQAQSKLDYLTKLPRELYAVLNYTHEGKLLKAEDICRHFMQKNKRHVDGMRMLADLARRFGILSDASFLLEMAVEFEPGHVQALSLIHISEPTRPY